MPIEDFEPGDTDVVGLLDLSLFGTRDATQNWTLEYTVSGKVLVSYRV